MQNLLKKFLEFSTNQETGVDKLEIAQLKAYHAMISAIAEENRRRRWAANFRNAVQPKTVFVFYHHMGPCGSVWHEINYSVQAHPTYEYFAPESMRDLVEKLGADTIKLALGIK